MKNISKQPNGHNLLIYRQPSDEDRLVIASLQRQLRGIPTFIGVRKPRLTLLPSQKHKSLKRSVMLELVHPLPITAKDVMTLVTDTVDMYPSQRTGLAAYVLTLKDPDGKFNAEHAMLKARAAKKLGKIPFINQPYVTIGFVEYGHATQASLELANQHHIPEIMRFKPLETDPILKVRAKPTDFVHSTPPESVAVRTLSGSAMPAGFLARLQEAYTAGTEEL